MTQENQNSKDETEAKAFTAAPCSGLTVNGVMLHLELSKNQEGKLDKGQRPYDDESTGWLKFEKTLEAAGAWSVDRGVYGGLDYCAKNQSEGVKIANLVTETLL